MKTGKFISAIFLMLIAITYSNCGNCDDEDDAVHEEQNTTVAGISKDSLRTN